MSFWKVDLTTEDGAHNAAQMGGFACFVAAALSVLGLALLIGAGAYVGAVAIGAISGVAGEIAIFIIAGFRLRGGRGLVWGSVAALLLAIEIVIKLVTLTGIPGLIISVILLVATINGVRGARALGRDGLTVDEAAEVFE
jgi:apolipoprotein N-acyltransferase